MITSRAIWHVLHGEQQKPMRQSLVASPWMLYTVRTARFVRRGARQFERTNFLQDRVTHCSCGSCSPRCRARTSGSSTARGCERKACVSRSILAEQPRLQEKRARNPRRSRLTAPSRWRSRTSTADTAPCTGLGGAGPVRQTARRRDARNQTHTAPRRRGPRKSRTGRW